MRQAEVTERPCLVTGHLLPWTGGPLKSIAAFQRALDANVVSFLEGRHSSDHALPLPAGRLALVPCHRLPFFRHFLWPQRGGLAEGRRLLEQAPLVSCHSFYNYHPAWVQHCCGMSGTPYWIVPHGILDPYVVGRNRIAKNLYLSTVGRKCLASAAATIFSSRPERDKAVKYFRVVNPVVVHWPVSIPAARDKLASRVALRQRLGLEEDSRIMLFLGRLHPMKRPLETIRLFAAAATAEWHLLLVGHPEGVSESECHAMAKTCGVEDRVHVIPGVMPEHVSDVIEGCDLFISNSRRENFNNAAAECLASGLPLLLSSGNDLVADIGPSAAIGVLPESPTDATSVIKEWTSFSGRELIDRGRIGAAWAQENLSFDVFRARLKQLLVETLAGHR
jgi:glycosyltransferase involved in cell wall biosynthesis